MIFLFFLAGVSVLLTHDVNDIPSDLQQAGEKLRQAICEKRISEVKRILEVHPGLICYTDLDYAVPSLHLAARIGNATIALLLLEKGACVHSGLHTRSYYGNTPLHIAAESGKTATARILIAHRAYLNACNCGGRTPLHKAVLGKHLNVVKLLVSHHADVNAQDMEGSTPLHYAVYRSCREIAEFLIDNGADMNARDNKGNTPLRLTVIGVRSKPYELADLLLAKGADFEAGCDSRLSVLETAIFFRSHDVLKVLVKRHVAVGNIEEGECSTYQIRQLIKSSNELLEVLDDLPIGLPTDLQRLIMEFVTNIKSRPSLRNLALLSMDIR